MLVNSTRHSIFCLHLYTISLSNTYLMMGQDHSVGNQWWACRQISYQHGVFLVSISVRLELSVEHFSFVSQTSIDSSAWNYTCMYSHTHTWTTHYMPFILPKCWQWALFWKHSFLEMTLTDTTLKQGTVYYYRGCYHGA